MGLRKPFVLFLFFLLLGFATPSHIRYEVLEKSGRTERSLLQQKRDDGPIDTKNQRGETQEQCDEELDPKGCPINMEKQNYTTVTSQCKGPHYSAKLCCESFKELTCKIRDALNDLEHNNCAYLLFNNLHLNGKYPVGLFASLCKEGEKGLNCEEVDKKQKAEPKNAAAEIVDQVIFSAPLN